jgi:hypothetical protein
MRPLLRGAVVWLTNAPPTAAHSVTGRLRRAALEVLLRSGLRRTTLPALLASLDDAEPAAAPRSPDPELVGRLRELRTTCLYRSLAGYAALRARGVDARFVLGVRRGAELVAHAWLEVDEEPVGETTDPRAAFCVAFSHPHPSPDTPPEVNVASFRADPEVILTELQDGTGVLLHLGTKFYYALNGTGVVAWKLLAGTEAVDAARLAEALVERFAGITVERARVDVDALLGELQAEGLLASGDRR